MPPGVPSGRDRQRASPMECVPMECVPKGARLQSDCLCQRAPKLQAGYLRMNLLLSSSRQRSTLKRARSERRLRGGRTERSVRR